ncbi:hypothetical protein MANES_10G058772v8 [Manihot esculenta]|uniref:Uncharacterized protein n=1 Tax=Manihot esculenta TaxID=3983 RepID=A0ACB7GYP3_MANES|nr:hypothetical protein MANES_10G058772v8 [Manihot esculenta]
MLRNSKVVALKKKIVANQSSCYVSLESNNLTSDSSPNLLSFSIHLNEIIAGIVHHWSLLEFFLTFSNYAAQLTENFTYTRSKLQKGIQIVAMCAQSWTKLLFLTHPMVQSPNLLSFSII